MARRARWMDGLDQDQIDFLLGLNARVAICRGRKRHLFLGLVPGEDIPDTIMITKPGGEFLIHEDCANHCGRWIEYGAGRNGIPDYGTKIYGGWKEGEQLAPPGLGLPAAKMTEFYAWMQRELVIEGYKLRRAQRQRAAGKVA